MEVAKAHDFIVEELETDLNHIHMIINCNPRYSIMKCILVIKSVTAYRLFEGFSHIKKYYLWGISFGVGVVFILTVGSVFIETVKKIYSKSRKVVDKTKNKNII